VRAVTCTAPSWKRTASVRAASVGVCPLASRACMLLLKDTGQTSCLYAAAAQALRLFFRARVTNPRLCGTPLGKPTKAAGLGPSPAAQHIGSHVPSAPHTTHAG
jgi:hypothetical protein